MGWIELVVQALKLTGNVLNFVQDSRAWKMKNEIEDLLEDIRKQEQTIGPLRDDQFLDEHRDILTTKLELFNRYLQSPDFQSKNDKVL